jgi:very-short-patch-repair endonuclease
VSFPLKCVIDLMPSRETDDAARARAEKRTYLKERGYNVCEVKAAEVEKNIGKVLDQLHSLVEQ